MPNISKAFTSPAREGYSLAAINKRLGGHVELLSLVAQSIGKLAAAYAPQGCIGSPSPVSLLFNVINNCEKCVYREQKVSWS